MKIVEETGARVSNSASATSPPLPTLLELDHQSTLAGDMLKAIEQQTAAIGKLAAQLGQACVWLGEADFKEMSATCMSLQIWLDQALKNFEARLEAPRQGIEFISSSVTLLKSALKDIDRLREETRIYHDQAATMVANLMAVMSLSEMDRNKDGSEMGKKTETVAKKESVGTGLQYL